MYDLSTIQAINIAAVACAKVKLPSRLGIDPARLRTVSDRLVKNSKELHLGFDNRDMLDYMINPPFTLSGDE